MTFIYVDVDTAGLIDVDRCLYIYNQMSIYVNTGLVDVDRPQLMLIQIFMIRCQMFLDNFRTLDMNN